MKKIICLLISVAAMLALVSCGECDTHTDADRDGVCDVCEAAVEIPGAAIFAAVASAEPTVITTMESVSFDGAPYVSNYSTTITEDGFIHDVTSERPAGLEDDVDSAVIYEWLRIVYADGVYTVYTKDSADGEYGAGVTLSTPPVVEYLNVKNAITAENVSTLTVSPDGSTLTATLTAEECRNIFGATISSETATLTIVTVGGRLSSIDVLYTAASGAVVNVTTSYSYVPVAGAAE